MDITLVLILLIVVLIILALFLNKKISDLAKGNKPSDEILEYLKTTNIRLNDQARTFNVRLDNAAKVISDVQRNIGEFSEIGRGMKDLQEFLSSPKLRGNIGDQVDAAIKTSGGIIPVDSKFPMENFRKMGKATDDNERKLYKKEFERDVKGHIDAISRKYILTEEGTMDYALMYIPSESVYYEVVNSESLFDYGAEKRVLPVSPTTFYAYIRAILMSFEGQKIEQQAKQILSSLRAIQKDYSKVEDSLGVLQKHMTNAYNMMGNVFTTFSTLGQKISSTQNLGEGVKKKMKELE
jgi:DNA recombination protein RmuC